MFFRPVARFFFRLSVALLCLIVVSQIKAQQNDGSLFVIKTPNVEQSGYGQRPKAIVFETISYQEEDTRPREDDGTDEDEAVEDEAGVEESGEGDSSEDTSDDLADLDDDVNELLVGDEEDDLEDLDDLDDDDELESTPSEAPMTMWSLKPMSAISPGMRPVSGKAPADLSWQLTNRRSMPNVDSSKLFAWAAPNITHNPLYFEDVALERYGQTRGFLKQPFVSGFHFLKSAAFLPYYTLYDPVDACDGPLGYCRPGQQVNCVESKHYFGNPFSGQRR